MQREVEKRPRRARWCLRGTLWLQKRPCRSLRGPFTCKEVITGRHFLPKCCRSINLPCYTSSRSMALCRFPRRSRWYGCSRSIPVNCTLRMLDRDICEKSSIKCPKRKDISSQTSMSMYLPNAAAGSVFQVNSKCLYISS